MGRCPVSGCPEGSIRLIHGVAMDTEVVALVAVAACAHDDRHGYARSRRRGYLVGTHYGDVRRGTRWLKQGYMAGHPRDRTCGPSRHPCTGADWLRS